MTLDHLQPTDSSPAAVAAALARCMAAGRAALLTVERLKSERDALLLAGDHVGLATNLDELVAAMRHATEVGEHLDRLQQQQPEPPPPSAAQQAQEAALALVAWWSENSPILVAGAQILIAAITAGAKAAAAAGAPPAPGNVVPLRSPPGP